MEFKAFVIHTVDGDNLNTKSLKNTRAKLKKHVR